MALLIQKRCNPSHLLVRSQAGLAPPKMAAAVTHRSAKAAFYRRVQLQEMAKGRAKTSSSEGITPPQPRALRSRKRECPSDEDSLTGDLQASIHQQDTEGNDREVAALGSTVTSAQQDQAAEQQQDDATEEKHAKGTNFNLEDEAVEAIEEREVMTAANPESQPESFRVYPENEAKGKNPVVILTRCGSDKLCTCCTEQTLCSTDTPMHAENDNGKEEITAKECSKSASQMCTDELHVPLPTSEEAMESCVTDLDEQVDARENCQRDLEGNQNLTSRDETSRDVCTVDVTEITKEAVVGFPAKKRRRMGMCGLTEKERSHFLQAQNGQNGPERVERQMCSNKADLSAEEGVISPPPAILAASVTAPREAEIELQSLHCERIDKSGAETEVHTTVCDPGCSEGKGNEAEGDLVSGPEQTADSKSDPPAEEQETRLGNPEQQEREGSTAEITAETQQVESAEKRSAGVETCITSQSQSEETERQEDRSEAPPLQVHSVTGTGDEKKEETAGDAGDAETSSSSTDARREGSSYVSLELSEAAATPGGSERNGSCGPDVKPASSPTMNQDPRPRDTKDPFGSGGLDYVSDSQLNTMDWTEEEMMDEDGVLGSSDSNEDATDLICGLIRELASLNRTVMVTHRELENLRRCSKSSRSSAR